MHIFADAELQMICVAEWTIVYFKENKKYLLIEGIRKNWIYFQTSKTGY